MTQPTDIGIVSEVEVDAVEWRGICGGGERRGASEAISAVATTEEEEEEAEEEERINEVTTLGQASTRFNGQRNRTEYCTENGTQQRTEFPLKK